MESLTLLGIAFGLGSFALGIYLLYGNVLRKSSPWVGSTQHRKRGLLTYPPFGEFEIYDRKPINNEYFILWLTNRKSHLKVPFRVGSIVPIDDAQTICDTDRPRYRVLEAHEIALKFGPQASATAHNISLDPTRAQYWEAIARTHYDTEHRKFRDLIELARAKTKDNNTGGPIGGGGGFEQ